MPPPCFAISSFGHDVRARIALLLRHGVPAPLHLAALRVVRLDVAGDVEVVAADADDQVVLDDRRGGRRVVEAVDVADLLAPALLAVLQVQRDEVAVGRLEVQPVLVDGARRGCPDDCRPSSATGSARSRVRSARRRPRRDPGRVKYSTPLISSGVLLIVAPAVPVGDPVHPGEAQLLDVGVGDLRERAEAPARSSRR